MVKLKNVESLASLASFNPVRLQQKLKENQLAKDRLEKRLGQLNRNLIIFLKI